MENRTIRCRMGRYRLGSILSAMMVMLLFAGVAFAGPKAIAIGTSGSFATIDFASTGTVVGAPHQVVSGGSTPLDVAVTPDKKYALISDFYRMLIYRVDISDPINPTPAGAVSTAPLSPEDITISPDGKTAVVANGGGDVSALAVIDLDGFTLTTLAYPKVPAGSTFTSVAFAPDNHTVLVGDYMNNRFYSFVLGGDRSDFGANVEVTNLTFSPMNIAVSKGGLVLVGGGGSTYSLKAFTFAENGTITGGPEAAAGSVQSIAFAPDGSKAYVLSTIYTTAKVTEYIIGAGNALTPGRMLNMSGYTTDYFGVDQLDASPDGKYLIATNNTGTSTAVAIYLDYFSTLNLGTGLGEQAGVAFIPYAPPTISGATQISAIVGKPFSFIPTATGATSFTAKDLPEWATFNTTTGEISGTPNTVTGYRMVITAINSDGTAVLGPFTLLIENHAPEISGTPATTATVNARYNFTPTASDVDGHPIKFAIVNKPAWATFNGADGTLSGVPTNADIGTYSGITISTSDTYNSTALPAFTITVLNHPPEVNGTPATSVVAGSAYAFTPAASDADGQTLKFSISNKPAWAVFDVNTGALSGTPSAADIATYNDIVISVTDGASTVSLPAFSIVVTPGLNTLAVPGSITVPATNSTGSFVVSWAGTNVSGATYILEQSINGAAFAQVYSGTSYQYVVSAPANASYAFRVKAVKTNYQASDYKIGANDCTVALALAPPGSITVPATNSTGSFVVTWAGTNVSGATYILEQSINGAAFTQVYSGSSYQYVVSAPANASYAFRVKAVKTNYQASDYKTGANECTVALALAVPSSITVPATNTTGSFVVSWAGTNVSGATYILEQSINGAAFTQVYSGSSYQYVVSAPANASYAFRVKAIKTNYQPSDYKTGANDCTVALALATPGSITVPGTNSTGSFAVSWAGTNVSGATYILEQSINGAAFTQVYSGSSYQYVVSAPTNASYAFRVKAIKTNYQASEYKTGANDCTVALALATPGSITVPATNSTGSFVVSWAGTNVSGATYILEQSINGAAFTQVYSGSSYQYVVSAPVNASYAFRVKAVKTNYQSSDYKTGANDCTVALALAIPGGIIVPATNTTGSFVVSWASTNVSGATYVLEMSVNGGDFSEIYRGSSYSFVVTGKAAGNYAFRVKAIKLNYQESPYKAGLAPCTVS